MKEIKRALKKLKVKGEIQIKPIAQDRYAVYVNNVYFGIWDSIRKTFVD